MADQVEVTVSQFVALFNQTLEYAYPSIVIVGELANFRVSKNRWVYFDLKDDQSTVKFFGTIYQLPSPLEDGMMLRVQGQPRLHNLYGFSVNIQNVQPAGEGSIRKAADLLKAKLEKEGLFDASRKRALPHPPTKIGLITSAQSAAYADFTKILNDRWGGLKINLIDVQVQGDAAPEQIVSAIEQFNALTDLPEVIVVVRGGGSAEDLAAFSTENVTRAVAASRVPTLVAIGHEIDVSLAELAADVRASTPSNAAEMLVPDRKHAKLSLDESLMSLSASVSRKLKQASQDLIQSQTALAELIKRVITADKTELDQQKILLSALSPESILDRGYAIVRHQNRVLKNVKNLKQNDIVEVELSTGSFKAEIDEISGE